jgi:ferredoxin-NADP reductase
LPIEQATLHYGAQTPDLLIYRPLADRCAAEVPGFQVRYYAEHQTASIDLTIHPGRINLAQIMTNTAAPSMAAFYLSGPKPMIESFRDSLITTYHLSPNNVLIDAWE